MTGHALLLVGAVAASASVVAALLPVGRRSLRPARILLAVAATALALAVVVLGAALVTGDYSLVYVADHTRRGASTWYRLAGLWGGMEGSLLFWTALLGAVALLGATRARAASGPRDRVTVAVLAGSVAAFAMAVATTANPFRTLQIPATDGGGLLPILEHPAMLVHPPLLYVGLVSTVVSFAIAVGALLTRSLDTEWRTGARRWLFVSWILLVLGMVTGANWAYVELGWGGYWAWDPIENTALLPWLAVTAALHQLLIPPQRRSPRAAWIEGALTLLAWVLAVLGTVITRSGAAVSVHAFGESDAVAVVLTGVWIVTAGLAVGALVVGRAPRGGPSPSTDRTAAPAVATPERPPARWRSLPDRSTLLRAQSVLLVVAIALILAGTATPVVRSQLGGAAGATTGDYFATWTAPIAWAVLALLVVAPALAPTGRLERTDVGRIVGPPILAGLAVAVLVALQGWTSPRTLVTAGLAGAVGFSSVMLLVRPGATIRPDRPRRRSRSAWGAHLAHLGFAILFLGLAGATAGSDQTIMMATGEATTVGGVTVRNEGARTDPGVDGNPRVIARFTVERGGRERVLEPEIVGYPAMGVRLAESALWSDPTGDVQLAMRTADDDGRVLIDIHVRPLTPLVWWGALVIAAGGIVAATSRRSTTTDGADQLDGGGSSPSGASRSGLEPAPRRFRSSSRPTVSGGVD